MQAIARPVSVTLHASLLTGNTFWIRKLSHRKGLFQLFLLAVPCRAKFQKFFQLQSQMKVNSEVFSLCYRRPLLWLVLGAKNLATPLTVHNFWLLTLWCARVLMWSTVFTPFPITMVIPELTISLQNRDGIFNNCGHTVELIYRKFKYRICALRHRYGVWGCEWIQVSQVRQSSPYNII